MTVQVDGYVGSKKVVINVGPVMTDTSLRDYLDISLNDYKDTTQWSEVSQAINEYAQKNVIDKADIASLKGKKISFVGAFTAQTGMTSVSITPVEIKAE
jgi:predicted lipoprotein